MATHASTLFDFVLSKAPASYEVEVRRLESAKKIHVPGTQWTRTPLPGAVCYKADQQYKGSGKKSYALSTVLLIDNTHSYLWMGCTCPDWLESGSWCMTPPRLCKHILAWAMNFALPGSVDAQKLQPVKSNPFDKAAPSEEPLPPLSFPDIVKVAVERAVTELALQIWEVSQIGAIPFLIGPTGCGKTSANRQIAVDRGLAFVEHAGSDAWTESDLVGIVHVNGQKFPGPIAAACDRARSGQKVHLLLDEFPRNNRRVQDGLMRFLQVTPGSIASAMGIPCKGRDIHITSAPFWGDSWANAEDISICLAGNPWGTEIDPALIRRTEPVRVDFDSRVAENFSKRIRTAIETSWTSVREGTMALPIEYQAIIKATGPDDLSLVANYVRRLSFLDPAGADGYVSTLEGLSIGITRSDLQNSLPFNVGSLGLLPQEAPLPF